jgi:apolipoprotein N-acyltransferase
LPVGDPRRTLVVAWGDWVGLAAAGFLGLLVAWTALRARAARDGAADSALPLPSALPAEVALLPPTARLAAGALRAIARGGLLWMVAAVLLGDEPLRANTLAQIRAFAAWFVAPEVAAWCLLRAFAARTVVDAGRLVFVRGARRLELALDEVAAVEPWRLPLPGTGVGLRLNSGGRWGYGITPADPAALARLLDPAGAAAQPPGATRGWAAYLQALGSARGGWLQRPWLKFGVLPLLLALPAFRLHQHIAYGGTFGEVQAFGLAAYLKGFALWWAAWAIGVALCATALRTAVEAGTLLAALLRPVQAAAARRWLEGLALAALYLGLPAWLLLRAVGG